MKVSRMMLLLGLSGMMAVSACKKDNDEGTAGSTGTSQMDIMLTDAPGDYEKVFIDLQEIEVNIEGSGWVKLTPTRPGIYNLLDLANGIDTMIASQQIPSGELQEVRLILGSRNSVVVNGVSHDLETPSAEQSGLKIKIKESIGVGAHYTIWIDFDANKSIVLTGSGKYILKPVIRAFLKYNTGSLKGDVNPDDAAFFVNTINDANTDTFTTLTYFGGKFLYIGLPAGSYHVHFYNRAGQNVKTINSVQINANAITDMGDVSIP